MSTGDYEKDPAVRLNGMSCSGGAAEDPVAVRVRGGEVVAGRVGELAYGLVQWGRECELGLPQADGNDVVGDGRRGAERLVSGPSAPRPCPPRLTECKVRQSWGQAMVRRRDSERLQLVEYPGGAGPSKASRAQDRQQETPRKGACRQLMEETGLVVASASLILHSTTAVVGPGTIRSQLLRDMTASWEADGVSRIRAGRLRESCGQLETAAGASQRGVYGSPRRRLRRRACARGRGHGAGAR